MRMQAERLEAPPMRIAPRAADAAGGRRHVSSMDREFIARNQIVERYIGGRLPLKGAQDFERFCREHPELLDEIALTDRINAGAAPARGRRPRSALGTARPSAGGNSCRC